MRQLKLLITILLLTIIIYGCKKNNPEVESVAVTFQVKFDEQTAALNLSPLNTEVTITNQVNGQVNKAKADANGTVRFESIIPGNYTIVSSLTVSAADYTKATGSLSNDDVVFNANLSQLLNNSTGNLELTLKSGRLGDWVLKQIYYGGSHNVDGAIFRDQFIEIYNNSNDVMYADSLYIGLVVGLNNSTPDLSKPWFLQSGQYDWTKSIGMNDTKANTDYLYVTTILQIPGDGRKYPIQPGTSFILAQNALNHKTPYISNANKEISVKKPELTVDLSNATFEAYYGDIPGISILASDMDNPTVPNVKVVHRTSDRDMILDNNGREAIVLFKTKQDPNTFQKYPTPDIQALLPTTTYYPQIPVSMIIDGVEMAYTLETKRVPHRLPVTIDAGFTFTPGGPYSSQSVIRKTSKIVNGRRILKDSNNSSEDFDHMTMADPSKTAFK